MLDKIKDIVGGVKQNPEEIEPFPGIKPKSPKHIAITIDGTITYSRKGKISLQEAYAKAIEVINKIISLQQKRNIPIISFYLLGKRDINNDNYQEFVKAIVDFFNNLKDHEAISSGKTKVSVIGKWYDLPGNLVDSVRSILDTTKDNDNFYANFCLNYDGQEEIVDACKLLVRQVMASKIDISQINNDAIKENLYSSYFVPPDIIIKNGYKKYTKGLMLWDSSYSTIYFSGKMLPDFRKSDFDSAIEYWRKN